MNGLMNIIDVIGADPMAKWVVAALGLRALWTIIAWRKCPLARGTDALTPQQARDMRQQAFAHSWRFLLVMVTGIVLAVFGLFQLAEHGAEAPLALFMLILGVYLFTTEPARHQVQDAERRVLETSDGPAEQRELSASLLRGSHFRLISIEVGIVAMLLAGVLFVAAA